MIVFDTIAIDSVIIDNMYQWSSLDYSICDDPPGYADLTRNECLETRQKPQLTTDF